MCEMALPGHAAEEPLEELVLADVVGEVPDAIQDARLVGLDSVHELGNHGFEAPVLGSKQRDVASTSRARPADLVEESPFFLLISEVLGKQIPEPLQVRQQDSGIVDLQGALHELPHRAVGEDDPSRVC